ncbi:MAG TPA: 5-deoxyglucuronate isomerase [Spirochaeta sp.]|nr:5-deoxyglucuronate isomerase [Spirochaeta sp.]
MIAKKDAPFKKGYTVITEQHGKNSEMLLDFGILRMDAGDIINDSQKKERAWNLISGKVSFEWEGQKAGGKRVSCFDESPVVLHVPEGVEVKITAIEECEFGVEACDNPKAFASKFYSQDDIRSDIFGGGILNDTSIRTVRTVFDGEINPDSNMVMGEVINHPGKWSSFPPHDHPQPEIYHYRFFPQQGFGVSLLGDDAHIIKDGDSSMIVPNITHSQVASAGYAMYYIWMIPHLPNDRWLPTTRYFVKDHEWLKEGDPKIWPELKYEGRLNK